MDLNWLMRYNTDGPVAVNYRTKTQPQGDWVRLATVNSYIIFSWPSMQAEGFSMSNIKYHQEDWSQWPRAEGVWYIYGLHLKDNDEIRYIGSTADVRTRFTQHLCRPMKSLKGWILANRLDIRIKILAQVGNDPKGKERRIAREYHANGHRLFNNRQPRRSTKKEREDSVKVWLNRLKL